ncbi:kinase-like domain-containing protein [Rhodofomes roseus]|uniref:Kinase-like domain-containing protein n=1 Tax=Rhodofomes roseus TaxID=34475 RepID=A0ABQ8KE25_9APHY|nr:kinase-like domain-containing protein [Rhodofomes roseus]KAH9835902.1 kinase-like domain-containing protein [Rhodofomes roseus]
MTEINDLATVEGVRAYISGTPFDSGDVSRLSGGLGNFTYRLSLRTPYNGHTTVILKHGKPYVPGMEDMAFSLERQVYEVTALRQIRATLPPDPPVSVPEVLRFDENAHVIIMSDCGAHGLSLKQALIAGALPPAAARRVGHALGGFLARFHARGKEDSGATVFFGRNEEGKRLSALVTYGRLVSTLTGGAPPVLADPPLEVSQGELARIAEVAGETERAMLETTETVVMGDFWPGNVLVSLAEAGDASGGVAVESVSVIDWEMAKTGLAGLDIGQFVAELHVICEFKPDGREAASNVIDAFLRAYREGAGAGANLGVARRALTHVGAHLVAWTPVVGWEGREKVREVVKQGVDLLVEGSEGTEEYMKGSILGPLLG